MCAGCLEMKYFILTACSCVLMSQNISSSFTKEWTLLVQTQSSIFGSNSLFIQARYLHLMSRVIANLPNKLLWCFTSIRDQIEVKCWFLLVLYTPALKFLFTLIYCCTMPDLLEYWWVFFSFFLSPTVPFTLGRLGIPIFGNKAIPSWLWHNPRNHFLPVSFSGRKWFTSLWIAPHWHRARPTDRRQNLAAAASAHAVAFWFLRIAFLTSFTPTLLSVPSLPLQCFFSI